MIFFFFVVFVMIEKNYSNSFFELIWLVVLCFFWEIYLILWCLIKKLSGYGKI